MKRKQFMYCDELNVEIYLCEVTDDLKGTKWELKERRFHTLIVATNFKAGKQNVLSNALIIPDGANAEDIIEIWQDKVELPAHRFHYLSKFLSDIDADGQHPNFDINEVKEKIYESIQKVVQEFLKMSASKFCIKGNNMSEVEKKSTTIKTRSSIMLDIKVSVWLQQYYHTYIKDLGRVANMKRRHLFVRVEVPESEKKFFLEEEMIFSEAAKAWEIYTKFVENWNKNKNTSTGYGNFYSFCEKNKIRFYETLEKIYLEAEKILKDLPKPACPSALWVADVSEDGDEKGKWERIITDHEMNKNRDLEKERWDALML